MDLQGVPRGVFHVGGVVRNYAFTCARFCLIRGNNALGTCGGMSFCSLGDLLHLPVDMPASEYEHRQNGESERNGNNCEVKYGSHDDRSVETVMVE